MEPVKLRLIINSKINSNLVKQTALLAQANAYQRALLKLGQVQNFGGSNSTTNNILRGTGESFNENKRANENIRILGGDKSRTDKRTGKVEFNQGKGGFAPASAELADNIIKAAKSVNDIVGAPVVDLQSQKVKGATQTVASKQNESIDQLMSEYGYTRGKGNKYAPDKNVRLGKSEEAERIIVELDSFMSKGDKAKGKTYGDVIAETKVNKELGVPDKLKTDSVDKQMKSYAESALGGKDANTKELKAAFDSMSNNELIGTNLQLTQIAATQNQTATLSKDLGTVDASIRAQTVSMSESIGVAMEAALAKAESDRQGLKVEEAEAKATNIQNQITGAGGLDEKIKTKEEEISKRELMRFDPTKGRTESERRLSARQDMGMDITAEAEVATRLGKDSYTALARNQGMSQREAGDFFRDLQAFSESLKEFESIKTAKGEVESMKGERAVLTKNLDEQKAVVKIEQDKQTSLKNITTVSENKRESTTDKVRKEAEVRASSINTGSTDVKTDNSDIETNNASINVGSANFSSLLPGMGIPQPLSGNIEGFQANIPNGMDIGGYTPSEITKGVGMGVVGGSIRPGSVMSPRAAFSSALSVQKNIDSERANNNLKNLTSSPYGIPQNTNTNTNAGTTKLGFTSVTGGVAPIPQPKMQEPPNPAETTTAVKDGVQAAIQSPRSTAAQTGAVPTASPQSFQSQEAINSAGEAAAKKASDDSLALEKARAEMDSAVKERDATAKTKKDFSDVNGEPYKDKVRQDFLGASSVIEQARTSNKELNPGNLSEEGLVGLSKNETAMKIMRDAKKKDDEELASGKLGGRMGYSADRKQEITNRANTLKAVDNLPEIQKNNANVREFSQIRDRGVSNDQAKLGAYSSASERLPALDKKVEEKKAAFNKLNAKTPGAVAAGNIRSTGLEARMAQEEYVKGLRPKFLDQQVVTKDKSGKVTGSRQATAKDVAKSPEEFIPNIIKLSKENALYYLIVLAF